ncbi:MAG: DUF2934 domain-containing protein [Pseudomonadota bacterium]
MIARITAPPAQKPRLTLLARNVAHLADRIRSGGEVAAEAPAFVSPQTRGAMISKAAYLRAAGRGFEPGRELEDWCAAEHEIDARIFRGDLPAT